MRRRPYLLLDAGGTQVYPDFTLLAELVEEAYANPEGPPSTRWGDDPTATAAATAAVAASPTPDLSFSPAPATSPVPAPGLSPSPAPAPATSSPTVRLEAAYTAFLHACHALDRQLRLAWQGQTPAPAADWFIYREILSRLALPRSVQGHVLARLTELEPQRNLWTYRFNWLLPTLHRLRQLGYELSVISNSDGRVAEVLRIAGVAGFFEIIVDSGVEGVSKPDPELFQRALARLHLDPGDALYVGDFYHIDVLGANRAQLPALLIDTLGLARNEGWPARTVDTLADLPVYLESGQYRSDDPLLFPFRLNRPVPAEAGPKA